MKAVFATLFSAALCTQLVTAHGIVTSITIDGKTYDGNDRGETETPSKDSPIRRVYSTSPVTDETDPQLSCGLQSEKATMVVDAMPGSKLSAQWSEGWTHTLGPIFFYMASCGSTSCDQFDSSGAKWFKISQQGPREDDPSQWYQAEIQQGKPAETTIPENLAPGGYLIRHELINLGQAQAAGGAEYYASCFQVKVGGNGSGVPDTTVSFPGAYRPDDPGLDVPSIYDHVPGFVYQFPGGPVAKISGGGNSTPAPTTSSSEDDQGSSTQTSTDTSSTEDAGALATSAPAISSTSMAATPSSIAASSPTLSPTGDVSSSMAVPAPTATPSPTNAETAAASSVVAPGPSHTETFWIYIPPASSTVTAMSSDAANTQKRSDQFSGGALPNGRMLAAVRQ